MHLQMLVPLAPTPERPPQCLKESKERAYMPLQKREQTYSYTGHTRDPTPWHIRMEVIQTPLR